MQAGYGYPSGFYVGGIAADTAGDISGQRLAGNICIANEAYLRYMGELEISRVDMPSDPRVNVIGQVEKIPSVYQGRAGILPLSG